VKNIGTFKYFTEKINELALSKEDYSRFDVYIKEISDFKKSLKNFNFEIKKLIKNLKKISYKDITFNKIYREGEDYEINFTNDIDSSIFSIKTFLNEAQKNNYKLYNYIEDNYFDGFVSFRFEIEINKENYNKIHIPINLPKFLKNIGLGKKILISAINKFGYLYFNSIEDSFEMKMVVDSLVKRKDIFSFMFDNKIFIFNDDYYLIENKLEYLFNKIKPDNYSMDVDFKEKYKLNNFLNKLYK
jgi:hypothetical protein